MINIVLIHFRVITALRCQFGKKLDLITSNIQSLRHFRSLRSGNNQSFRFIEPRADAGPQQGLLKPFAFTVLVNLQPSILKIYFKMYRNSKFIFILCFAVQWSINNRCCNLGIWKNQSTSVPSCWLFSLPKSSGKTIQIQIFH